VWSWNGVSCGSTNVPCPNACNATIDCACSSGAHYFGACTSTAGNCQFSPPACDGQVMDCESICPQGPIEP
jgi:hypothetical protein